MTPDLPPSSGRSHRKRTLFCPSCGHESESDGDWDVREEPDRTVYECPDCGESVTVRPRSFAVGR
ncbi:phage terminase large subunit family protein [Salinilacihabitans rarus]|uniref:phage terminase large subunit family protein n=1 Tax=Salinilacihabitans rarus TaxID=2961596 RepID=UPI0020C8A748|nr:phage terminase large subunit family protein [Salinilacihabitans rarus]